MDLDVARRGKVEASDILRFIGGANRLIDYESLHTVMQGYSTDRSGRLTFQDFCRWMGPTLRETSSLIHRHDSSTNPEFQSYMEQAAHAHQTNTPGKLTKAQILEQILGKIEFCFGSLIKAFHSINLSKGGKIQPWELKFFLTNWGLETSEEVFQELFDSFDADKDGVISLVDFKQSIGSLVNPRIKMVFRQEFEKGLSHHVCQALSCDMPPAGSQKFCFMHLQKMERMSNEVLKGVRDRLGEGGEEAWARVKRECQRRAK